MQALEDAYRAAWRPEQREKVFFRRRRTVVQAVRAQASRAQARSYDAYEQQRLTQAVEATEQLRVRLRVSLYGLAK